MGIFRMLSPEELVAIELMDARRNKLEAETARDYATSIVAYNATRVKRLTEYHEAATNKKQDQS